jgi:hypothetical protein
MKVTGLGGPVPVGLGLITSADLESATRCVEAVQQGDVRHALAAKDFAHEDLDSGRVLSRTLALARVS